MRDFAFKLTAEDVAKQTGVSIEEARKYIRDLKYVGFFMSASNGDTIEILPPDLDKREKEIESMKEYEKSMPTHEELIKAGIRKPNRE